MPTTRAARSLVELRILDGPNLYFPRPAAKVTLDPTEVLGLPIADARDLASTRQRRCGTRSGRGDDQY
jgi:hypothetical protein